ncbi:MAG: YgaP family membrane protein [Natronomonas sp.]
MEKNVGGLDRTARFVVGIVLGIAGIVILAGYWTLGTTIGALALVVGLILLVTGATQTCPINQAAGIDTTK